MASQIIGLDAFRPHLVSRTGAKLCKKSHGPKRHVPANVAQVLQFPKSLFQVNAEKTAALVVTHREALTALCIEMLARVQRGELTGLFVMMSSSVGGPRTLHVSGCFVDDLSHLVVCLDSAASVIETNTSGVTL